MSYFMRGIEREAWDERIGDTEAESGKWGAKANWTKGRAEDSRETRVTLGGLLAQYDYRACRTSVGLRK